MPQLAPLSWIFLSISLFFILFCMVGCVWWMKKSPLVVGDSKVFAFSEKIWLW